MACSILEVRPLSERKHRRLAILAVASLLGLVSTGVAAPPASAYYSCTDTSHVAGNSHLLHFVSEVFYTARALQWSYNDFQGTIWLDKATTC
jgi:hypothetical protein